MDRVKRSSGSRDRRIGEARRGVPAHRSFGRGVAETVWVLAAFVAFGVSWAQLGPGRDAPAPASYPPPSVDDPKSPPAIWLVDGFNVLHAAILGGRDRREWWTEPRRRELLERVRRFDDPGAELWVVFDGPRAAADPLSEPVGEPGGEGPRAVFAESADAWLLDRVRAEPDPARIAVVTADRAVAGRARHRGAHVVSPRAFLERCRG